MASKINHRDVGDVWEPQATFTVSGTPTDPTNITVKVRDPSGTVTTMGPASGATGGSGVTRVSAGVFKISQALTSSGYWTANFTGTGAAAGAEDQEVIADPSLFAANAGLDTRALVGLQETKDWLQQQNIDTSDDLDLVRVINDVSNRFYDESEREFKVRGTNPQTRTFDVAGYGRCLDIDDLASSPTQVQIISSDWTTVLATVASTDYTLYPRVRDTWEPYRRILFRNTILRLRPGYRVNVTGTWGFPAVPGSVRQAVLDAVASIMDRDVEHYQQDQGPQTSGEGTNVVVFSRGPQVISLPPSALAVARYYNDSLVG